MFAFLFKACIVVVYLSLITPVARQLNVSTRPKSFQISSFFNRDKSTPLFSSTKNDFLHNIKAKFASFKMVDKESTLASLRAYINTPATCNTERVAMGTRELSIRLDVLLSALAAGSFAWMCLVRFKR